VPEERTVTFVVTDPVDREGSTERLSHGRIRDLQLLHASSWSNRNEEDK
jgi:hypothetical protein